MTKRYADLAGDGGSNILGQVRRQADRMKDRLSRVDHVVAIASAKGGVGKSLITASIASVLSARGRSVGVLDTDINGPSLGKILGVRGQDVSFSEDGLVPATGPNGMRVMTMDLLLPGDDSPVTWRGPAQEAHTWRGTMEVSALRELLTDTVWGDLSVLLLDLPPGSDRLPNVAGLLPDLAGVIVVTIPSEVALLAVRKGIRAARDAGTSIIGLVENMASYACPGCGEEGALFRPAGAPAADLEVPHLGSIPFDPRISGAADRGEPFVLIEPEAAVSRAIGRIADALETHLEEGGP